MSRTEEKQHIEKLKEMLAEHDQIRREIRETMNALEGCLQKRESALCTEDDRRQDRAMEFAPNSGGTPA